MSRPALPLRGPEAGDPCNVYDFQEKPIVIFSLRILIDVISAGKYITDREPLDWCMPKDPVHVSNDGKIAYLGVAPK